MLDYQAIIKSDTATRLLNVFTFEYNNETSNFFSISHGYGSGFVGVAVTANNTL